MISEVLTALAKQRPVFHSEADFQHAIAWELHECLPGASIRLERPLLHRRLHKLLHVDVWVEQDEAFLAIELKYKTRALQTISGREQFALLNQSAQDIGRYDFVKDVRRVEDIVAEWPHATGYAILLTNDPSYWSQPRSSHTIDADFRLHEGRELRGDLDWGAAASEGTKRGREELLRLSGTYPLHWNTYSQLGDRNNETFGYLIVEVSSKSP